MTEPKRIQLSRKKGWRMPENTVKVDRTNRIFGNDFKIGEPPPDIYRHMDFDWRDTATYPPGAVVPDAAEAVRLFTKYGLPNKSSLAQLRGKNLACWCPLPKDGEPDICHASILLEIANR